MAMNKKEKAEFDAAIARANMLAALRWTSPVVKDVSPPGYIGNHDDTSGWDFNASSRTVSKYWSGPVSHGTFPKRSHSGSQNSKALFSSKALALKALRHAVETDAALTLARIDAEIAAETEPA